MSTNRQTRVHDLTACVAFLRGEARIDSYHPMTSSLSLIFKDTEERAPTGVVNALSELLVASHPRHVQVFDTDMAVPLRVDLSGLEVEVAALAADLQVR